MTPREKIKPKGEIVVAVSAPQRGVDKSILWVVRCLRGPISFLSQQLFDERRVSLTHMCTHAHTRVHRHAAAVDLLRHVWLTRQRRNYCVAGVYWRCDGNRIPVFNKSYQ